MGTWTLKIDGCTAAVEITAKYCNFEMSVGKRLLSLQYTLSALLPALSNGEGMTSSTLLLPTVTYPFLQLPIGVHLDEDSVSDCGIKCAVNLKEQYETTTGLQLGYSHLTDIGYTTFSEYDSSSASSSPESSQYFTEQDSPKLSPVLQHPLIHSTATTGLMSASNALNYVTSQGQNQSTGHQYNYQQPMNPVNVTQPYLQQHINFNDPQQIATALGGHQALAGSHPVTVPPPFVGNFPAVSSIETPQGTFYFVPNTVNFVQPQQQQQQQHGHQQQQQQAILQSPSPAIVTPAPTPVVSDSTPNGTGGAGVALAMPTPIHPMLPMNLGVSEYSASNSPGGDWEDQQFTPEEPTVPTPVEATPASIAPKIKAPGPKGGKKGKKGTSTGKAQSRRFMCPHEGCGRAFARNFNMQSHLKSHLGIRDCMLIACSLLTLLFRADFQISFFQSPPPVDCPHCNKKFSRRHDRARHCAAVHDSHEDDYNRVYHEDTNLEENQRQLSRVLERGNSTED